MAKVQDLLLKLAPEDQKTAYQRATERFEYVGRMFLRNETAKQYAELVGLDETLKDIENQAMLPWSDRITGKRRDLSAILSQKHCRAVDRRQQQADADTFGLEIIKLAKKFEAVAALQQARTRILGLDVENEHQVLGSSNAQPAAGPQPE